MSINGFARTILHEIPQVFLRGIAISALSAAVCLGLLSVLVVPGCGTTINDKDVDKNQVSVGEVRRLLAEQTKRRRDDVILLIDTRPATEFAAGHIPGARNISLASVRPKAALDPSLKRYENLVVYANDPSSASARAMVKRLMSNGYDGVVLLAGGMYQWRTTGGEVAEGR